MILKLLISYFCVARFGFIAFLDVMISVSNSSDISSWFNLIL